METAVEKGGCQPMMWMDYNEAGAHWHEELPEGKLIGGEHTHILDDMMTILKGGAHGHDLEKDVLPNTQGLLQPGGPHVHEIVMPDGRKAMTQPLDGADPGVGGYHQHITLPNGETVRSGAHVHTIQMPDGVVHKTLGFDELKAIVEEHKNQVQKSDGPAPDLTNKCVLGGWSSHD